MSYREKIGAFNSEKFIFRHVFNIFSAISKVHKYVKVSTILFGEVAKFLKTEESIKRESKKYLEKTKQSRKSEKFERSGGSETV